MSAFSSKITHPGYISDFQLNAERICGLTGAVAASAWFYHAASAESAVLTAAICFTPSLVTSMALTRAALCHLPRYCRRATAKLGRA